MITYLSFKRLSTPKVFTVDYAAGPCFFKFFQSLYCRNIGNPEVPAGDDNSIKPFHPPVIMVLPTFPQNNLPLCAYFFDFLNCCVIRYKVPIASSINEALDISLYNIPFPKWSIWSVIGY
jgi:hypothetical protein